MNRSAIECRTGQILSNSQDDAAQNMKMFAVFLASWIFALPCVLAIGSTAPSDVGLLVASSLIAWGVVFTGFYLPVLYYVRRRLKPVPSLWLLALVAASPGLVIATIALVSSGTLLAITDPKTIALLIGIIGSGAIVGTGFGIVCRDREVAAFDEDPDDQRRSGAEEGNPHVLWRQVLGLVLWIGGSAILMGQPLSAIPLLALGGATFADAWSSGIYKDPRRSAFLNIPPMAWGVAVVLLFFIAYPL